MYSRLAKHCCKNGHYIEPTLNVAAEKEIICPICKEKIHAPSAEELALIVKELVLNVVEQELLELLILIRLFLIKHLP